MVYQMETYIVCLNKCRNNPEAQFDLPFDSGEVPADAFRIGSLTVITKGFQDLRAHGPAVQECLSLGDPGGPGKIGKGGEVWMPKTAQHQLDVSYSCIQT